MRKLKGLALDHVENDPDMDFMDGCDGFDKLSEAFKSFRPKIIKPIGQLVFFGTGGGLNKDIDFAEFWKKEDERRK